MKQKNHPHLLCIGSGYCARAIMTLLANRDWSITTLGRSSGFGNSAQQSLPPFAKYQHLSFEFSSQNMASASDILYENAPTSSATTPTSTPAPAFDFTKTYPLLAKTNAEAKLPEIAPVTHVLISVPPDAYGDRFLSCAAQWLHSNFSKLSTLPPWIGYFSATSVYGDHHGQWVDEDSQCRPTTERGRRRCIAEAQWRAYSSMVGARLNIFRLGGIYGPRRSYVDQIALGIKLRYGPSNRRVSRIHRDDIANLVALAAQRSELLLPAKDKTSSKVIPNDTLHEPAVTPEIYNLVDSEPADSNKVINYAINLFGMQSAAVLPFAADLITESQRSFHRDNKLVSAQRLLRHLNASLIYPTYREGLTAIYHDLHRTESS